MDAWKLQIWTFEKSGFFVKISNFEISGQISPQKVIYGPYGPYILLKSPYMDRTDLIFLEESPYMDRQSPDEQGGGSGGR